MTMAVGILAILHGLTHLWYVTLSLGLVEFTPEMGWSGRSWLLSGLAGESLLRTLAVILYSLAAIGFVLGGVGLLLRRGWFRDLVVFTSVVSMTAIVVYWDGAPSKLVEKGLIGLVLSLAFLVAVRALHWPGGL